MTAKKKMIIIIGMTLLIAVLLCVLGIGLKQKVQNQNDRKAAEKIEVLIAQLDDNPITEESENLLFLIKAEYDVLSNVQKEYVTNYSDLEKAFEELQQVKDRINAEEIAKEMDQAIIEIDVDMLTAEDVLVERLIEQYKGLTKEQKSYVKNYDLLKKYKKIVEAKAREKKQRQIGMELAENFRGYEGSWGDFGGHINVYQGMIEMAIRKDVKYKQMFLGDVDELYFTISRFEKNSGVFGVGIAYFSFNGIDRESGYPTVLYGEVIIKSNGALYCTTTGYY